MGNQNSIQRMNFEDIQHILKNKENLSQKTLKTSYITLSQVFGDVLSTFQ